MSDATFTIFCVIIVLLIAFFIIYLRRGKLHLIHRLYFCVCAAVMVWLLALIGMKFTPPEDTEMLYILDAVSYIGGPFTSMLSLLIAITFVNSYTKLPRRCLLLLAVPLLSNIMVWTNPLHHLFYRVFSVNQTDVVFGPFMYVSGICSYLLLMVSIVLMITFAVKSHSRLYIKQAICFTIGELIPLAVSFLATFKLVKFSNAATPLAFTATLVLHGFAIFYFHMLDIMPLAQQHILYWISDGYMVVNKDGLIVSFNVPFYNMIGQQYGLRENTLISNAINEEDAKNKTAIYNLLTAIESCRGTGSSIAYEQPLLKQGDDGMPQKKYYMVEITPLASENRIAGFVIFYKDVTLVKDNMQKLQDSQLRMMEQERLAFLGQMVGGIAHNLKTPIMSISGTATAVDNLVQECIDSMDDPEVNHDDYMEIYGEIRDWLGKMKDACAYMSDIITAVKGQAANMNTNDYGDFTADELIKNVSLLLRHELIAGGCKLIAENETRSEISIHGDINSMVQVINNLVSNAIFAMKPDGGEIRVSFVKNGSGLEMRVADHGCGVPEDVRRLLFKQMITSKGSQGTGLGVFISQSVIKAKFDGTMWLEDNPGGGSIFVVSIPGEYVSFEDRSTDGGKQ